MKRLTAGAAVLATVLLAGCATSTNGSPEAGSSQSSAADPGAGTRSTSEPRGTTVPPAEGTGGAVDVSSIDPCKLVTKDEADAVTGVTLQKPVLSTEYCNWPTPTSGSVGQFEVFVGPGAKKIMDIDKVTLKHEFTDVPGVGDEAHAEENAIFFRTKGVWVAMRIVRLDSVDTSKLLVDLATKVTERI